MGVDVGHMGWNRLAQAIPLAYTQLLAAQAVMHEVHNRFGVPIITHDDLVRAQPSRVEKDDGAVVDGRRPGRGRRRSAVRFGAEELG